MKQYRGIIKTRTSSKYFAWMDGNELFVRKEDQGAPYPVDVVADNKGCVRLFGDRDMRSTRIVEWPESLRTVKVGTYTKHGFAPFPSLGCIVRAMVEKRSPGSDALWDA